VINRYIVDDCDLLVGVFWTRLGSPTGKADSGTIEEIERVGKAGKPIMLYFSSVQVDPDKIDPDQINKLKQFKEKTYPNGLIEKYKTVTEFKDKFSKHLDRKVDDLQRSDASGEPPLSLKFLSFDCRERDEFLTTVVHSFDHPSVSDMDVIPQQDCERVKQLTAAAIREMAYIPLALAIENSSSSGIRNLYVELDISTTSQSLEVTQSPSEWRGVHRRSRYDTAFPEALGLLHFYNYLGYSERSASVEERLAKFDADKLQNVDGGWKVSFEWEAIQPQRTRIIKPALFIYSPESAHLTIQAKVYADSFPEPVALSAKVNIEARQTHIMLADLLPNWQKIIEVENQSATIPITFTPGTEPIP
jgi:hypothetical protein